MGGRPCRQPPHACHHRPRFRRGPACCQRLRRHPHAPGGWRHPAAADLKAVCRAWRLATHLLGMAAPQAGPSEASVAGTVRLAVVGDVHGAWDADDAAALRWLAPDAAVFVGDFGEEDQKLVASVAGIRDPPIAVILGNHDAWYSLSPRSRQTGQGDKIFDGARAQLAVLGEAHVGYGARAFTAASGQAFSIVGSRPFSKGGSRWPSAAAFYETMYGVGSEEASAQRIAATLAAQPSDAAVVVAAHNGPTGLGSRRHDICGLDFISGKEGDFGDPDLRAALDAAAADGRSPALVVFGHMHHQLARTLEAPLSRSGARLRNMAAIDSAMGTAFLNCAVVPRHQKMQVDAEAAAASAQHEGAAPDSQDADTADIAGGEEGEQGFRWQPPRLNAPRQGPDGLPKPRGKQRAVLGRHFVAAELRCGALAWAADVWVEVQPGGACREVARRGLVASAPAGMDPEDRGAERLVRSVWRAHGPQPGWEPVVSPGPAAAARASR